MKEYKLDKLDDILTVISETLEIPKELIKGKSRKTDIIIARHIYFNFAKKLTIFSLAKIGEVVNRNHSTVTQLYDKFNHSSYLTKDEKTAYDKVLKQILMLENSLDYNIYLIHKKRSQMVDIRNEINLLLKKIL